MSPMKILSGVLAAAGLVWAMPTAVLAETTEPMPETLLLAQSPSSDTLDNLQNQPDSADDLAIDSLTDDQVAQLIAIFETYQPQIDMATGDYLETLAILNDLLEPQTSDLALTNARNDVVAADQVVSDLVFQRNLAIRSVLTLDQRQVINDYVRAWLGIAAAAPVLAFPMNLVGNDATTTIADLQADGWVVAFATPGEVGLNRDSQKLNLEIDRNNEILTAVFVN